MSEVDVVPDARWLRDRTPSDVVRVDQRIVDGAPFVWVTVSDALGARRDRTIALRNVAQWALRSLAQGAPASETGTLSRRPVVRIRFESEVDRAQGPAVAPALADELVERRPDALGGQLVLRGTRIGLEQLSQLFRMGTTEAEVLAAYPTLDRERVRHVKAHALAGSA